MTPAMKTRHNPQQRIKPASEPNEPARQAQSSRLLDRRPEVITQRQLFDTIHNGPRMSAQRNMRQRLRSGAPQPAESRHHQENHTGLPAQLKTSIESLSGHSLDDVRVHYNSAQPAQLAAAAYTQGTNIHVGPGQERHLAHEAWHVVQQKQGRVRPTLQMKTGISINDDAGLEKEADVMGERARKHGAHGGAPQHLFTVVPAPVVQHKKTVKPANGELIAKFTIGHKLPSAVLSGKITDSDKGDAIWSHLNTIYDTNRDNGRRYWGELTKAISDYKNIGTKTSVENANTLKRTGYDSRFGTNYSNTVEGLGASHYRVNTKGYDTAGGTDGQVHGRLQQ